MVIPLDGRLPGRSSSLTRGLRADRPSLPLPGACPPIRPCTGWGLPSRSGHPDRGALLPHRFTLTARPRARGGLLSVALSVGSPPLAVSQHPARRCPDFPPARCRAGDHPAPSGADQSKSGEPPHCTARAWLVAGPALRPDRLVRAGARRRFGTTAPPPPRLRPACRGPYPRGFASLRLARRLPDPFLKAGGTGPRKGEGPGPWAARGGRSCPSAGEACQSP